MNCVTTVTLYILINGYPSHDIIPTRIIRQGDPISPYLYFMANGFSNLIKNAQNTNNLSGISITKGAPNITHLFFVDDNLIFCKAEKKESMTLLPIINT